MALNRATGLQPRSQTANLRPIRSSVTCITRGSSRRRSRPSNSSNNSSCTTSVNALEHLVMHVDGFNATKAQAVYPPLQTMQWDSTTAEANLQLISQLLPARLHGQLFTNHPQLLLETDMQSWLEFITSFGLEEGKIADLLRSSPEVFYRANIFQAGQLLLFLRSLQVAEAELISSCFKWAAALRPDATQARMAAVAECLQQELGLQGQQQLIGTLQLFPEVLGWDVEKELKPKLQFFQSLGEAAPRLLAGTLYDSETGFFQGLRSWHYSVQPKLQLLQDLLGSEAAAQQLITKCPGILKLPVETKIQPVLAALAGVGLDGKQLAQLLQDCPKLLAEPKEGIVSRINFLSDAVGSDVEDLLLFPDALLLSLADTIGPRYYCLARLGRVNDFSDNSSGTLQLKRVFQPPLEAFLADMGQVTGEDSESVRRQYDEMKMEWDNLLGWCADKAFSNVDGQISSLYQEQVNMFYVLVQ